jgi:hypothetical protein
MNRVNSKHLCLFRIIIFIIGNFKTLQFDNSRLTHELYIGDKTTLLASKFLSVVPTFFFLTKGKSPEKES